MAQQEILLGNGVFHIGNTPVGLTRGGGQFVIEREYRDIPADGDKGTVKGRTVIDKSTPKLTMNLLELISDNLTSMFPGMNLENSEGKNTLTGTLDIIDSDYIDVKWVGQTKSGKGVIIKVLNAINLENFDWTLADKDEVVSALTYTGTYTDGSEPWSIEFVD